MFKKGSQIEIKIPLKIPHIIPIYVCLKIKATINGLTDLVLKLRSMDKSKITNVLLTYAIATVMNLN